MVQAPSRPTLSAVLEDTLNNPDLEAKMTEAGVVGSPRIGINE